MYYKVFEEDYPGAGSKIYDAEGKEWGKIQGAVALPLMRTMEAYVVSGKSSERVLLPATALRLGEKLTLAEPVNLETLPKLNMEKYVKLDDKTIHLLEEGYARVGHKHGLYEGPLYLKLPPVISPANLKIMSSVDFLQPEDAGLKVPLKVGPSVYIIGADGISFNLEGYIGNSEEKTARYLVGYTNSNKTLVIKMKVIPVAWIKRVANNNLYLMAGHPEVDRLQEFPRTRDSVAKS